MSSKIIFDVEGKRLKLTAKRLIEVDYNEYESDHPWATDFTDLQVASRKNGIRIYDTVMIRKGKHFGFVTKFFRPTNTYPNGMIGCRQFSRETFNEIMRAAKAAGTKAAKAAKAGAE
jgi:hypothetical protein